MIDTSLVGVSVARSGTYHFLRIHLRQRHIDKFNVKRFCIRGQAANGFIIAPDADGLIPHPVASKSNDPMYYLTASINRLKLDMSPQERPPVYVAPQFERGHIFVPRLPKEWITDPQNYCPATRTKIQETGKVVRLSRFGGDGDEPIRLATETKPLGATSPQPKAVIPYELPKNDRTVAELQAIVYQRIADAQTAINELEQRTGMKLALDRGWRLVVVMPAALKIGG